MNILVNNAGILKDQMSFNMTEDEFDIVVVVHLERTFNLTGHTAEYFRTQSKGGKGGIMTRWTLKI